MFRQHLRKGVRSRDFCPSSNGIEHFLTAHVAESTFYRQFDRINNIDDFALRFWKQKSREHIRNASLKDAVNDG